SALQLAVVGAIVNENGELIAADATGRDVRATVGEPSTDRVDQRIAGEMANAVIDELEIIDVEQNEPERFFELDRPSQKFLKTGPVRQVRQRIKEGQTSVAAQGAIMLDGQRTKMHAGFDKAAFQLRGAPRDA